MVPTYDEVHVCKLSAGWKAHFDGSSACEPQWWDGECQTPRIGSMDDLRGYLGTGEWELVDEHGDKATLDYILEHDSYMYYGKLFNTEVNPDNYLDREGHPWSRVEFS